MPKSSQYGAAVSAVATAAGQRIRVKSIDPSASGKLLGVFFAVAGFLFGAVLILLSLVGAAAGSEGAIGALVGSVLAIIVSPVVFGGAGFVIGILAAMLYNVAAGQVGGIAIEIGE